MWQEFLANKFTPTELENARSALEELPDSDDESVKLTREEIFLDKIMEGTAVICKGQRTLEDKGEKHAPTTCGTCGYGTACRGRQLGVNHREQLGG